MATVLVGCNLPNGLIMELIEPGPMNIPAPAGKRVTLAGANSTRTDKLANPGVNKFAFTAVDAEFAADWFKRNKDAAFVTNGSVFMQEKADAAKGEARDRVKSVKTGLEPLSQDKDPRIPSAAQADKDQLRRLGAVA
jgi:hypothetical protein